jgi:3'-5' exoribonuclease
MSRRFVEQLADGDAVEEVFLVSDKQLRANRNGNIYLQMELRDRTGTISARLWNVTEALGRSFEAGDYLLVRGKVQLFQGALQMILSHFERVDGTNIELSDFLPHTGQPVDKLFDRLRCTLRKLSNPHLRALAECFLMDDAFVRAFCRVPAGVRLHHAYVGGLLEHVVTLLDGAERLLPVYPELDRDLVLIGLFLHDAGKVRELSAEHLFAYTDEGQLIGHLVIGSEMVSAMAARAAELTGEPFPRELLLRVKHVILSHHGQLDYGSPKVPMTPEAIFVHQLDMLDARVHMFLREIREDRNQGTAWTQFHPQLQRRLFKGGGPGTAAGGAEEVVD